MHLKLLAAVAVLSTGLCGTAIEAAPAHPSRVIVFGDSLSDPGNHYAAYGQTAAAPYQPVPDAPYAIGGRHFTNGATWVELLASDLGAAGTSGPALGPSGHQSNYAVGRARARAGAAAFPEHDLATQVATFLGDNGGSAPADALYVVWIGANDLNDALQSFGTDPSGATAGLIMQQALGSIAGNMLGLYGAGARRFLVLLAPDLGLTPAVAIYAPGAQAGASFLSAVFNQNLSAVLAQLGTLPGFDIVDVDVNGALAAIIADPGAHGFAEAARPCLDFFVSSGANCAQPQRYLFWDAIHPTTSGHKVISALARDALAAH